MDDGFDQMLITLIIISLVFINFRFEDLFLIAYATNNTRSYVYGVSLVAVYSKLYTFKKKISNLKN